MISIVIPTYNSAGFMPALMESIFKQAVNDMEVIIVDDCSTDNTLEIVAEYPVRIIKMEKNGGPARARNKGVEAAKGDVIFFLDSDVLVMDGTIKEVEDYFKKDPSANCVIGMCATEPLNKGFVPKYMAMFEYIHLIGIPGNKVSVFATRCGAIRKNFFLKVGGYAESYKGADIEDFDFARKVTGVDSIVLNPKILVRHKFANNFKVAARNYFKRAAMWIRLFMKVKKFDNAGPTAPSNGIAAVCAFLSFISLFFIPVIHVAGYVFVTLLVIFFFANLRWWNFMREEAGFFFAVKALFLNYVLGIDVIVASIYGLISYFFSQKETAGN